MFYCISCGGDLREFFQEEIGRMDGCGIISPVLLIHYCYKLSYFASHGSTVYMAALDARKAFDRVNHVKLFDLLPDNNVFSSVIYVHSLSVCLSVFSILC